MIHSIKCNKLSQNSKKIIFLLTLISVLQVLNMPLQAQIGRYTKVDKAHRNTYNFADSTKTKKKQKKDKSLYTVYSDQLDNKVYFSPYAQIQGDKQAFLKPYYVVNQKKDYLELVAHDPTLIGKPKGIFSFLFKDKYTFSEYKKTKYVGWIHKDNILNYDHPKLSKYNYKPMKYIVGIHDIETLYNIENHVKKDSVYLFKDPKFQVQSNKKLNLDQLVYLYKYNTDKNAVLVSNLDNMKAEDSITRVMGWIPKALLKKIGQQRVFTIDSADSIAFLKKDNKSINYVNKKEIGANVIFDLTEHKKNKIKLRDSIKVVQQLDVWDHSDNKLINVDGEYVLLNNLETLKNENKTINFHYVFDCSSTLRKKHLKLMSSLQQIWVLISTEEKYKDFKINFSASSYGCGKFYSFPQSTSFSSWIDYLHNIFMDNGLATTDSINTKGIEQCFNNAIKDLPLGSFANNIILVAGEHKFFDLPNIETVTTRLGQTSSRLIFYQLENQANDKHQEYILQSKDILNRVSKQHADFIRAYIVDNALIKNENVFKNIPSVDNIYVYDAPKNSTYQGGIVFPKINKALLATSLDTTINAVLNTSIKFNSELVNSLEYNTSKLGYLRSKTKKGVKELILKNTAYTNSLDIIPRNYMQEKYYADKHYVKIDNLKGNTAYLLSKHELTTVVEEYKSLVPLLRKIARKRDRVKLYRTYKKNSIGINRKLHKRKLTKRKHIADLVFLKTGLPVNNEFLQKTQIKHVKRRRKTSNLEFTKIIKHLREKIEVLEKMSLDKKTKIYTDGSGIKYYLITDNYIL